MTECRLRGCGRQARDGGGFAAQFCSTACELKYQHLKADARDARRAAQERGY